MNHGGQWEANLYGAWAGLAFLVAIGEHSIFFSFLLVSILTPTNQSWNQLMITLSRNKQNAFYPRNSIDEFPNMKATRSSVRS
ncbi:hypothetical protein DM02DRAFT_175737 [Periconia macrospinosa]|uniref:Uncharacterized protein n=1 Tax=Periconia macrospinosa TaxID=97972 RepID=A0A2V1DBE2_9PLEO|nr:hypothetical protein DM02DRAFT_175737 [Periconia macrospinosa]